MITDAALRKRVGALLAVQRELIEKLQAVNQEIDELLGGGVGIGQKLKECYAAFNEAWGSRYANGSRGHYQFRFQEDTPSLKRFLKTFSVEELSRRFVAYIADADPFLVERRHPFGLFVRSINQYAPAVKEPEFGLVADSFQCEHSPRCRTRAIHETKIQVEVARI